MEQDVAVDNKVRFIVSHGDKGGVGKSMIAQSIADFLYAKGSKVAVIEADTQNPDVERMFAGLGLPTLRTDLRNETGWMEIVDFVDNHPGYHFVLSTPAGIGDHMKNDIPMLARFLNDREVPVELELWWTLNLLPDSMNLFHRAYESYGKYFKRTRMVRNLFHGNANEFIFFNESSLPQKIAKDGNGIIIDFPALHLRVVKNIFDPEKIMPFSSAVDASLGESVGLTKSEQYKLIDWHTNVSACLAPAFEESQAANAKKRS